MNKVVIVTGINSRLGQVIAKSVLEKGYFVVGGSRSKPQESDFEWKSLDLTKYKSIEEFVEYVVKKYKKIDALIHVAGVTSSSSLLDPQTSDEFENMFKVNVLGQYNLNNFLLKSSKAKGLRVITITSLCGISPVPNFGIYCATKFSSEAMNIVYHMDYSKLGVRFTNITPGAIEFESKKVTLSHPTIRDRFPVLKAMFPFVTPDEIAKKIVSLIDSSNNPPRIILGRDAQLMNIAYRILPLSLYVWFFKRIAK